MIMIAQRNYGEYNLDNILDMGYEAFEDILSNEVYSLVLVYRLHELMSNFEDIEEYMFCHVIQCWFVENRIHF
jgi:hypothetical protein